jgi:hypothetical protein
MGGHSRNCSTSLVTSTTELFSTDVMPGSSPETQPLPSRSADSTSSTRSKSSARSVPPFGQFGITPVRRRYLPGRRGLDPLSIHLLRPAAKLGAARCYSALAAPRRTPRQADPSGSLCPRCGKNPIGPRGDPPAASAPRPRRRTPHPDHHPYPLRRLASLHRVSRGVSQAATTRLGSSSHRRS